MASTLSAVAVAATAAISFSAAAAELTVDEGVVVKFGSDAELVVRDRLSAGKSVILTSQKDDTAGGQTNVSAQTPAAGDWRGLRIEKSASGFGSFSFSDLSVRWAGANGSAALWLRGVSPSLQYVQITDSTIGLRLLDSASPAITGSSFLRNGTGLEANSNSLPTIGSTQFAQNSFQALVNNTAATTIVATGNWWGHPSGPRDPVGNPAGQGDAVSTGINYGNYLASAPLIAPSVRLAAPASYYDTRTVSLEIACVNATEYRIAEGTAFAGLPFQSLANGRATVNFTLSEGDGTKPISVQFRNATGTVATGTLTGGVLVDTQSPQLTITNPAPGSVVTGPITIEATASDASGIAQVQFYLDGALVATRTAAPYTYSWNNTAATDGNHGWRVVATDRVGRATELTRDVLLSRAPVVPDTDGPQLANVTAGGAALVNGASFSRNTSIAFQATDRSGISRIELLLDGVLVGTANGSSNYSVLFDLGTVANGAHTLALRAVDSLNNTSTTSYNITVAHAVPDAPVLSAPASGSTTRDAQASASGTAKPGSSVQLLLNGSPFGSAVIAGSDGRFSAAVTLVPGANVIQARATDTWGTSALSTGLNITLDVTVPASPGTLTALAQAQGRVRINWVRSTDPSVTGYQLYRAATPFSSLVEAVRVHAGNLAAGTSSYDDLPAQDGTWYYRVVAVNGAGTPSLASNQAQAVSDGTLPRALSVVYSPQGRVDAATGRVGQGRVNVVVNLNEPLQATPYLSLVPQGGTPITIELSSTGATTYAGSFVIDANTASGLANALFSARDVVGNRGTDIDAGATLLIDTEGPALSGIAVTPSAPIRNESAPTIQATFTFSKAPKAGTTPSVSYLLSGPVRPPVALTGLTQVNATTWRASFTLPADAGLASPENLSFASLSQDDLDNVSARVTAFNRFQVYQGNLPPLNVPLGFTAVAQPGGRVRLNWQPVTDASSYQIYRQAPGQSELVPLLRAVGETYLDQTAQDGAHRYAIATVRQSNSQESVSTQSAAVDVVASANAPGAPQALALQLTGQGIVATWQPPLASNVATYNLYRATGTSITSIQGLTPLRTGIRQPIALDPTPSPTQGAYVVTALDAAGNESAISNSAYLNASLLPVSNLRVEQLGNELPVVTWNAPNGNIAGYHVYVGAAGNRTRLTSSPITARSYTDSGYTNGERLYTIATVDANGVEMPRSLLLPNLSARVASGLPVKRGVMNKLQVQVANTSGTSVSGARVVVRLPINREATQFQDHRSEVFSLGSNQTQLVPVIVGGYADLPSSVTAQVGVEIAPVEGEMVKVSRNESIDVTDGAIVLSMATEEFTRGATGRVRLTVENTSEVDLELLTATNSGNGDSTELRFKIVDGDNNILATQSYKQALGANVITLPNGLTVARVAAGQSYTSDAFLVNVPASSPNNIRLRLEVDKLRYHTGQDDQVTITGRGTEQAISLIDTAYYGEVTNVTPISSFGDQDVVITGRALDRRGNAVLPNTRLKLVLNQQGFERTFSVVTDGSGQFNYTFRPTITDSGLYRVSAVHPDVTDRSEQRAFTINRVTVGPATYRLDVPKNYAFSIPLTAQAGPGTSATNLRLVYDAASQPSGQLPAGVSLQLPVPVNLTERQRLNVPVRFTASNDAALSGSLVLNVISDEHPLTPIGQVTVNYTLSEARPYLTATPTFIETGLSQGGNQIESVLVENKGLQDALNLRFTITRPDGSPAPSWASIASRVDGSMAVGEQRSIDLSFAPPASTAEGIYEFRLRVEGDNIATQSLNVFASVTQSGQGNVLFKAADIYTATVDRNGRLIPGLAGATVTVQNEDVASVIHELVTDSLGEALFQGLPAGRYKFRARASNHQEVGGRFVVKPGITHNQSIFLDYNLVTVEWSVREITIQDRYEITLNATFETDVPAAVVVMQPASVNLPRMNAGDVYYGEINLTNYGLIRADNVRQRLPASDPYFRYEFLVEVPETLEAKQRVTIPYRVISTQSLNTAASSGTASGGGCYSYSNSTGVGFSFRCKNDAVTNGSASTSWFSVDTSTCPAGTGGGGGGGGGGGWGGGWGGWGGGGGGYQSIPGLPPCTKCNGLCCGAGGGSDGSGQ